jgi:hypothetical protein
MTGFLFHLNTIYQQVSIFYSTSRAFSASWLPYLRHLVCLSHLIAYAWLLQISRPMPTTSTKTGSYSVVASECHYKETSRVQNLRGGGRFMKETVSSSGRISTQQKNRKDRSLDQLASWWAPIQLRTYSKERACPVCSLTLHCSDINRVLECRRKNSCEGLQKFVALSTWIH